MYDLDAIRNQIDLRSMVEEAGGVFKRNNSICPIHGGDNPTALGLYDDGKRWHCFTRCPQGENDGDVIDFYRLWKRIEFKDAVQELAQRAGLDPNGNGARPQPVKRIAPPPPPPAASPGEIWQARVNKLLAYGYQELRQADGEAARRYLLQERGLAERTWEAFQLGYIPKDIYDLNTNWGLDGGKVYIPKGIMIPCTQGETIWYLKVRRPVPEERTGSLADYIGVTDKYPGMKFGGPRGGKKALFGSDLWIGMPVLILTEGEWDCMLAWQEGAGLADYGTLGAAKNTIDIYGVMELARYSSILVVHDADQAGEEARSYWQEMRKTLPRIRTIQPPDHDLSDYHHDGMDLRLWIAEQVGTQMEQLLGRMDAKRYPEIRAEWEKIYASISEILEFSKI